MQRYVSFLVALILILTFAGTVLAQGPDLPEDSDPTWSAAYWNNKGLSGGPALQREETNLDHDWGAGSPHSSVNADGFSARWTKYIYAETDGTYRFTATSDDGVRVWVDNNLIIDQWTDHPPRTFNADRYLSKGHHWVQVEFYENRGGAVIRFTWGPALAPPSAWRCEFFNNPTLSGNPDAVRDVDQINFDWGAGSPSPGTIGVDRFSARCAATLDIPAGRYRFSLTVDDGGRLWVNNHLLIDAWKEQPATTYPGEIYLPGGPTPIAIEYYENGGNAVLKLLREPLSPTIQDWRGEYFGNMTLSGSPALVRNDAQINFDWGAGSPSPGTIAADQFSARWTRTVNFSPGRYRFVVRVDDGARLWVNNRLLIDAWRDQPATTYTGEIDLPAGAIPIKLEYYERAGLAVAQLSWDLASSPIHNWRGEYYNNITLSGSPALVRDDAQLLFDWGNGSPAPNIITTDSFSARWTRTLTLSPGRYRFMMTVDDGGRLWVNNQLLIDAWRDQAARTYTGEIDLPGGSVSIRMEYYERAGQAVARLSWDQGSPSPSPGTIVVDDTDPGFVKGGSPTGWRTVYEGYGGHLTWTWNNDWQRPDYNWARWSPSLAPGQYEVWVYIPDRYTTTSSARYLISHAGGYTSRVVNQSANGARWVSLGTYWFSGSSNDYVSLTDVTGEAQRTQLIAFDAMRWVPR